MTSAAKRSGLWRAVKAILSALMTAIGAGLSAVATMSFGGRAGPGDLPTQPPREYRP